LVSQAGSVLLVETVRRSGLDAAMSAALAPWRKPRAVHDPGKILLDVALGVAVGGDCFADVALARAEPAVFGPVAPDPGRGRDLEKTFGHHPLLAFVDHGCDGSGEPVAGLLRPGARSRLGWETRFLARIR
jgi:hypothetical protein